MSEVILTGLIQGRKVRLLSALSALACAPILTFAALSYQPQGFVSDFAGVLSADERSQLESKLSQFEATHGAEISVAIIPSLVGNTVENVAVELFEQWGIGKKGKDNGLLLLVAQEDRELRIEVGYGLEGVVTDLFANRVISQVIVPEFKAGNFGGGITKGMDTLIAKISGEPVFDSVEDTPARINYTKIFEFLIFGVPYMIFVMAATPSWWLGGAIGRGLSVFLREVCHCTLSTGVCSSGINCLWFDF